VRFLGLRAPSEAGDPSGLQGLWLVLAAAVATLFVAGITETALITGLFCILFPEMGALAQDVFTRPGGTWSNAPFHLVLTPSIAASFGILVAQHSPYGYLSVLVAVGGAVAVLNLLRSPVTPAISAALLPVVFREHSWWYPLAVLLGAASLALLSAVWKRIPGVARGDLPASRNGRQESRSGYRPDWAGLMALSVFLLLSVLFVKLTGSRLLLFPPLAVIAFEVFTRRKTCSWADRIVLVPVACFLTASGGLCACKLWGVTVIGTAASMAWGLAVVRILRIHLPPAIAVALIPLLVTNPTIKFPLSVAAGTLLLTVCAWCYGRVVARRCDFELTRN
jgi:hypothetical protein